MRNKGSVRGVPVYSTTNLTVNNPSAAAAELLLVHANPVAPLPLTTHDQQQHRPGRAHAGSNGAARAHVGRPPLFWTRHEEYRGESTEEGAP